MKNLKIQAHKPLLDDCLSTDKDIDSLDERIQASKLDRYLQDTQHRKTFALWVRWLDSVFLGLVLIIVVLQGCKVLSLSTSVLNTLLATTTIDIIGLAYIILHGLFDTKHSARKNKR